MSDEVRRDAIDVMKQGGYDVVDSAIEKWWSGKYPSVGEDFKQERIRHWKSVREEIDTICSELKKK